MFWVGDLVLGFEGLWCLSVLVCFSLADVFSPSFGFPDMQGLQVVFF